MVRVWKPKPTGKATLTAPWNLRDDWIASLTFAMTAIPATPTILRSMLATRHFEISQGGKKPTDAH
jgi:hypothetical protein